MKTDCNVARDLMPLCIDDAASEESVMYLNDHLSQCEECKALFEDMKAVMPKREAAKTAQDQAQFGQLAHMMKQMHRWRVWRNVIIGVLAGILAVVGVYAGWQGLMVQYHAEYPTKEYKVSLAQLSDGRVVVGVNYLQSKRNIGLVIGGSSKSLRIWFETTIIPQNMATENKNGPVYIISNIEKIDTIAIGVSKSWASCHPSKLARLMPSERQPELQNRVQTMRAGTDFPVSMAPPKKTENYTNQRSVNSPLITN